MGAWLRAQRVEQRKQGEKGTRKREERERETNGENNKKKVGEEEGADSQREAEGVIV